MRKLIVSTFLTLDGVMQGPGGPEEDEEGGFTSGGWTVPHWDEDLSAFMGETMTPPFDLVLGRRTYELFASFWPNHPDQPGAKPLNDATKYVASRGRPALEWGPSVPIEGDAAQGVSKIKEGEGPDLQVHGSANLLQSLIGSNLVDRYRLLIFPVVIGSGKRLFADGTIPAGLRLVDSSVSGTGVVMGTYERAGELKKGSFTEEFA
jgi:dihydrofolate reductase